MALGPIETRVPVASSPEVGTGGNGGRPWVGIAANAHSGRGRGRRQVERLVEALAASGLEGRIAWTPPERAALVADAAHGTGCRCLVAVGGDGTVAALINERPTVPMTVLPAGTENLFARHFGMRDRPEEVAATIARGQAVRIDLGRVGARRFALMVGVGFDADVVTRHHLARVGRSGQPRPTNRAAYVEPVLRSSLWYRFPPLTIRVIDPGREETLTGTTAFVFNLPRYALGLPVAPNAQADDGWLDLVVFRGAGPFRMLHYLWLVFRGLHLNWPGVTHRRVGRIAVSCAEAVPFQLDGDPGGSLATADGEDHPWAVEVLPGALDVVVPHSFRPGPV